MKAPTAIVYTSSSGFTEKYAEMLARATKIPAYRLESIRECPAQGASVVYLGWLCAGKIKGLSKARGRFDVQAVCAVGMAPEYDTETLRKQNTLPERPVFYLRGGYDKTRLKGVNKVMMSAMTAVMKKKSASDEKARAMYGNLENGGNWVSEAALSPVVNWVCNHP